jgi:hypothetical protein
MKIITFIFSLLLSATMVSGQQTLFPQMKGYKTVSDYPVYTPDDLWDYINGGADAYLALGFIDLNITEYVKGKSTIKAEIYSFGNDAEAFGIYALERSPSYTFLKTGVQGYAEEGVFNFYKGRYYIKIMTHSQSRKTGETMNELAEMIAGTLEGNNDFPSLLKLFPSEGLIANQETYILNDVLGHEFLSGAFRASYEVDNDRFEIYLIEGTEIGEVQEMTAKLTGDAFTPGEDTFKYIFEDGFNGLLFLALQGERLIIISGLESSKASLADRYIAAMLR